MILFSLDCVGVEHQHSRRLLRRAYHAKGANYIWHLDGYDKIKQFGFAISGCVDGFSRKIICLNVYTTNNNPRIFADYFHESLDRECGCLLKVHGDLGTENTCTYCKQIYLSFGQKYLGDSTINQTIDVFWGHLRKHGIVFWMHLFYI